MSFWEHSEWTCELSWKQLRINKFQLFKYCHLPSCWGKNIYARSLLNSDYEKELWKCEAGALFQVSLSARVCSVWGTLFYGCRQIKWYEMHEYKATFPNRRNLLYNMNSVPCSFQWAFWKQICILHCMEFSSQNQYCRDIQCKHKLCSI